MLTAIAVLLSLPALASAAPPANDAYQNAATLPLFTPTAVNDTSQATQTGEPFTPPNAGFCGGNQMVKTVWFKVTAQQDGPITVNTFGSNFDTMVVPYKTDGTGAASSTTGPPSVNNVQPFCSDDAGAFSLGTSRVSWDALDGQSYLVQVGGFYNGADPDNGFLRVIATDSAPLGDNRADAQTVTAGNPLQADNEGGTEQPGESLACSDGNRPLGSTVWFHYVAPDVGRATFTSTGPDTVMQVYRGSDTTPIACNDDAPNQVGPSRVSIDVTPGDYYIQVGGYAGVQDLFTLSTEFAVNLDVDGDGSNRPADCNDNDPSIHPGATDIPDNNIDEDCSGTPAENLDRDGDGYNRPQDCNDANPAIHPGAVDIPDNNVDEDCNGTAAVNLDHDGDGIPRPRDCNDNNPAIRPGAHDIPGDRIDQDCSGSDARLTLLDWRYDFFIRPDGTLTSLTVNAKRTTRIRMSCRGSGCPGGRSLRSKGRQLQLRRFFTRRLVDGATIQLIATRKGFIGRVARITYHRSKPVTKRELCLVPGKKKPTRCP